MALTKDFIVKNGLVVLAAGSAQSISTTTGAIVTPGGVGIGGNVNIGSTINSTNATNGALTVAGGASVQQDLWVGGDIYSRGNPVITSQTLGAYGVSRITAGVGIQVSSNTGSVTVTNIGVVSLAGSTYLGISAASGSNITLTNLGVQTLTAGTDTAVSSTTGTITVWNTSTLQSITARGASTINAININNQAASNSTNSGALQVLGGVGVGGSIYAGNLFANGAQVWTTATLTNLGQLSNTTTQYLTSSTLGQYGVSSIQPGTGITVSTSSGIVTITNVGVVSLVGSQYLGISAASGTSITLTNLGVQSLTAGADISVSASTGTITVSGTGTFQTVTNRGSTTTNAIRVNNTTSVNSTATGALQVVGGVGIGGGLFVGGTITATSLTIGGYPISTSSVMTASYFGSPLGTFTNLNFATGTTATIVGGSVTLQSVGASVTVSDTPPTGPAPGNLWWDSTVGILRVYYADGTSNQWVDAFPIMVGPTGPQGATGVFTGTISTQLGLTNNTASTSTNTGALTVGGGVGIGGDLYVGGTIVANQLTIQYTTVTTNLVTTDDIIITTNNTSATSTTTGALRIAGGAGIGGALYVGATSYVAGSQIITTATIGSFAVTSSGYATTSSLAAYATTSSLAAYATTSSIASTATSAAIAYSIVNTSTLQVGFAVNAFTATSAAVAYSLVGSGSLTVGSATTATNIAGGTAGMIHMQSTTGTTSFINAGTTGQLLQSQGSTASFVSTTTLQVGNALLAVSAGYATTSSLASYATTASLASYATTSSIASTATSAAVAYSIVNTSTLQVGFAVNQAGGSVNATTGQFSGITTVTNVTASTTTATGALQVAGGVGIGKNINVGPGATNRSIANANAYGNMFVAAGDSQYVNYILGIKTTTNAATGLTTDHNTAGAANQIILPNSSAYGFKAYVTARDSVNQWMGVWEISGGIRRGATAASTTLVGTPVVTRIAYDTTATTWAATVAADTTNGGLQVRVTGTGTTNITWVANVLTIEVA